MAASQSNYEENFSIYVGKLDKLREIINNDFAPHQNNALKINKKLRVHNCNGSVENITDGSQ